MDYKNTKASHQSYVSYMFVLTSFLMLGLSALMAAEANNWYVVGVFLFTKVVTFFVLLLRHKSKLLVAGRHVLVASYVVFMIAGMLLGASLTSIIFGVVVLLICFMDLPRLGATVWSIAIIIFLATYSFLVNYSFTDMSLEMRYLLGAAILAILVYVTSLYNLNFKNSITADNGKKELKPINGLASSSLDAQYDVVLDSIADGIIVTDETGVIKIVNNAALEILDDKRENLVGGPAGGLLRVKINNENIEQSEHPVNQVLQTKKQFLADQSSRKKVAIVTDEKTFRAGMSVNPVIVGQNLTGVVMLFRDMTEIEKIDRAKSEFVSLASHQLRTPLNVVSWYIEKMMRQKKGPLNLKQQEYANQIYENNKRMILLVGDLLNASRVDLGKLNLKKEQVDLIKLANQLVDEVKIALEQKKITFNVDLPKVDVVYQDGDVNITTVIIQNLLSNAMKYTDSGGEVSFKIEVTPTGTPLNHMKPFKTISEGVLISVADNGIGIPKEQQKKIFGKLFRAENVETLDVEGSGLGLYVTQSFAQALDGEIWFESEEGEGTTFFVYLPFPTPLIRKSTTVQNAIPGPAISGGVYSL